MKKKMLEIPNQQSSSSPYTMPSKSSEDDPMNFVSLDDTDIQDSLDVLLNSPTPSKNKYDHHINNKTAMADDFDYHYTHNDTSPSTSESTSSHKEQFMHSPPILGNIGTLPPLMNAVQMEVQENAKVPNLYHVPKRRDELVKDQHQHQKILHMYNNSNSNHNHNHHHQLKQQQQDIANIATAMTDNKVLVDEILRLTEADLTLTENFLGNGQRMSAAAAYSNAGALMSSIGTKVASIAWNYDTIDSQNNDATATKQSNSNITTNNNTSSNAPNSNTFGYDYNHTESPNRKNQGNNVTNNVSTASTSNHISQLHHSYSYGRSVPLPIPTKTKSKTSSTKSIQHASLQKSTTSHYAGDQQNSTKYSSLQADSSSVNTNPFKSVPFSSSSLLSSPSLKSTIAPAPTPSVLDATIKRSQFGFGGNHTVPSVPLPPTQNTVKRVTNKKTKPATTSKAAGKNKYTNPIPTALNMKMPTFHEGASYERKKQRAKDARVKLNESIERLSVAINLAGNQSKQRAQAHAYWSKKDTSSLSPQSINNDTSQSTLIGSSSRLVQNVIKDTTSIMEEAGKTADSAKKWERPSFVGSAATMIQNLNAQCEALMRELVDLKKLQNNGELLQCQCGRSLNPDLTDTQGEASENIHDDENENDTMGRKMKRIKVSHDEKKFDMNTIIKRDMVILRIASFLDPKSILRFMYISKSWQVQLSPLMKDDSIWSSLCVKRFGASSVREWLDEDDENDDIYIQDNNGISKVSHMKLYRKMNESNVKRKCYYEGNIPLGNGVIQNIACAWITAVERSNGETLRSVLTLIDGERKYVSLPVVELRILIQNIGIADTAIVIPEQIVSIDASTKRRGEEMFEITSDERMTKKVYCTDGSIQSSSLSPSNVSHTVGTLTKLDLYESVVLSVFIHAKACPTTSKFRQRANFAKILLNVRGTTIPLIVPINKSK